MKNLPYLIFDLDDTIFETRSIGTHHIAPIFEKIRITLSTRFPADVIDAIVADLWRYPFDHVVNHHQLSRELVEEYSLLINSQAFKFDIETYPDFGVIRNSGYKKVLVTTGFKNLQLAKVAGLNLDGVFEEIYVDEVDVPDRKHKQGIFEEIVRSNENRVFQFLVVGDNPESELKAGRELGLTTVQVAKYDQPRSVFADHYIQHFDELLELLK